jgi:hypothetical protein
MGNLITESIQRAQAFAHLVAACEQMRTAEKKLRDLGRFDEARDLRPALVAATNLKSVLGKELGEYL